VNHDGQAVLAHDLVDAAADAGADAVKFQTFDPASMAAGSAPLAEYQAARTAAKSQLEMLERLILPREVHRELKDHAASRNLLFLSSPFDEASADFLEQLEVVGFKIPSGEITNHPLLEHIAGKGKPMLISTGMSNLHEVQGAFRAVRRVSGVPVAFLHCVSSYPAPDGESNLRAMDTMRREFGVPTGWSDHTLGVHVAIAAAAVGADIVEKHLTLDRSLSGPDHWTSLEPSEFSEMVSSIHAVRAALGNGTKAPSDSERSTSEVARKSLHWRVALARGTIVTAEHLIALRPGSGIPPSERDSILGRRVTTDVPAGSPVRAPDLGAP
jgi:N-acetylneuraminate synthase/N,N'-diacetyllegionaminate synthase